MILSYSHKINLNILEIETNFKTLYLQVFYEQTNKF